MLNELGEYEPFGKRFLKNRRHLVKEQNDGQIFSTLTLFEKPPAPSFHKLFSLSDDPTIDIGAKLDEKKETATNDNNVDFSTTNREGRLDNPALALNQEVYVEKGTVIWSRCNHIIKSFMYKDQLQTIQQVLFAWFPVEHAFYNEDPTQINSIDLYWAGFDYNSSLDAQQQRQRQRQQEQQQQQQKQNVSSGDDASNGRALRRALCVVFQTSIDVHFGNGLSTTIQIPFTINNVSALDRGLLVSRKRFEHNKLEKKVLTKKEILSQQTLSSLTSLNMYTNIYFVKVIHTQLSCPVITIEKKKVANNRNTSGSGSSGDNDDSGKPLNSTVLVLDHLSPTHQILYTSTNPDLPIVVTCNSESKHFIWCFENDDVNSKRQKDNSALPIPLPTPPPPSSSSNEPLINPGEACLRLLWKETAQRKNNKRAKLMPVKSTAFMIHNLMGEPQICIMNHTYNIMHVFDLHKLSVTLCFTQPAKAAIPIQATRDNNFYDLLYLDNGGLHIFIDRSLPVLDLHMEGQDDIKDLVDPIHDHFTIVRQSDGRMFRYAANFKPESPLIRDCLAAINCAIDIDFASFWFRYIQSVYSSTIKNSTKNSSTSDVHIKKMEATSTATPVYYHEWSTFVISLLSCFQFRRTRLPKPKEESYEKAYYSNRELLEYQFGLSNIHGRSGATDPLFDGQEWQGIHAGLMNAVLDNEDVLDIPLSSVVRSLHVLYEEYRVQKTMQVQFRQLGYLLLQCSLILGNKEWIKYYESHGFQSRFLYKLNLKYSDSREVDTEPPNIQMCLKLMAPDTSSKPTILSYFGVNTLETSVDCYRNHYGKMIHTLWQLYSIIRNPKAEKDGLLIYMVQERITRKDIELLDDSVSLPILSTLDNLKLAPSFNWPKEAYYILGRNDIYKQLQLNTGDTGIHQLNAVSAFKRNLRKENAHHKISMSDIMKESSLTPPAKRCTYESDILDMETERLRFGFGGYIEEIRMMLDASRTPFHFVPERPDTSDEDVVKEHQDQVGYVCERTLALATGRALFAFATHLPDVKKALPIETITLAAKILPLKTLVELDEASISNEWLEWPRFHNGVAAGLRIVPNSDINESWIDFCNPYKLDPHHGGVLFGMGLNGTLKKLPMVSWYRLMTQYSCDAALIGFILGASSAYRGTKDRKMTKILSVHIPSLLPPNSAGFNHSNILQASCLIGLGLVFMSSCDRFMTCVMLHEIGKDAYTDPSLLDANFESCSLAAGFALGFITLGSGDDSIELIDLQLRDKLYNLMTDRSIHLRNKGGVGGISSSTSSTGNSNIRNDHRQKHIDDNRFINVDVTSPGATLALGLMYLKTENQRVANKVDILESQPYMNYVRPDFLLIRVIAKNLIMWFDIEPTLQWIQRQIPDFITAGISAGNVRDQEASKQAKYNIQCGAFLCIGLRYAGSKNEQAFKLLIEQLDQFVKLWQIPDTSFHQRVTKRAITTCVDVLCTSAAMVMAGTGRQELASRLKVLYKRLGPKVNYGNHMAVSMSLGLLFMGLGGYTFSSHNESIAALLCAFYPLYPMTTDDNRFHLQAFRHLWVIAADSRWLMPIDVDKDEPCRVPMYLTMYENDERKQPRKLKQVHIEAPSVLPDYKMIKSICIDSNRYWPLNLDMVPGEYTDSVMKSGLIYIKKYNNTLSYEEDPQGRRLVFALDWDQQTN